MFGNDTQCRAPNSGRRQVWSSEGIKQPLQGLKIFPKHCYVSLGFRSWKDIFPWLFSRCVQSGRGEPYGPLRSRCPL